MPAIPIFTTDNEKLAIVYNSTFTINSPDDTPTDGYQVESSGSNTVWDQRIDPNPDRDGMQVAAPRRLQTIYRLAGWVRSSTGAGLHDRIRAMNAAFDPVLAYLNDPSTFDKGYLPLDFSIPTADTTSYPNGLIPARVYAAAIQHPVALSTKFDGLSAHFELLLRSVDPVAYLQSTSSANRTGNGTLAAANTLATYPSWPIWEIAFTTAPSGEMTIQRTSPSGVEIIYLDHTQLAGSQTLIIDAQARTAYYTPSGVNKIAALKPASRFFQLLPGVSNTITFAGFPSDASLTVTWRRAFV